MKPKILFILLAFLGFFISSCQKEDDPEVTSNNVIDTWKVNEQSPTFGIQNYNVDISQDPSSTSKLVIDNFFNFGMGHSITTTQNGQTITISNAVLDGYTFNGSGTISSNSNTIQWNYSVDDGNGSENVNATYTRM